MISKTYKGNSRVDDLNWKEIPLLIYVVLLGFIGGIVASIDEQRKDGKTMPLSKRFFSMLANGITSGFSGLLMYFLYSFVAQSDEPSPFMFFLVGVSGWLGGGAIRFFVVIWKSFINTQVKDNHK